MGELSWLIDLDPFPLTTGTRTLTAGLTCIGGDGTGCLWSTPSEYLAYTRRDTHAFVPLELTIRPSSITRLLQFGHTSSAGHFLRQLQTLSISCSDPVPVFAPYVLEPLVMALSAAGIDLGVNAAAGAAASTAPPPPPAAAPGGASVPPVNTTSDAAIGAGASQLLLAYSRLYTQPTLGSPLLRSLSIQDCALTGQLPPASFWLQLPSLERLDLSRNQLSGPLPATFGPAPPLTHVNLSYNNLSGPLTASQLRYGGCGRTLDLSYNNLRGELPDAWLESACTLYGKVSVGLTALPPRRRRQLGQEEENEKRLSDPGPDGGVSKMAASTLLSYKVGGGGGLTAVTESTSPSSGSLTTAVASFPTTSDSYPFWQSYPMSYMYGGDDCPLYGFAWLESVADRVRNGTGGDGNAEPPQLGFTVVLYGNPHLRTPGAAQTGYAAAASRFLHFSVRENACTIFEPLPELLWVWGSFGTAAFVVMLRAVVKALLAMRHDRLRVAPSSSRGKGSHDSGGELKRRHLRKDGAPASLPTSSAAAEKQAAAATPAAGPAARAMAGVHGGAAGTGGEGGQEGVAPAPADGAAAGRGGGGMAPLIIVAHARRVSARAARRLSQYGNAMADVLEAIGIWLLYDIPWGPLVRATVAAAVHVFAAGLTYAMAQPQRTVYCTDVRPCGPYLYVVPSVLSVLSIGLTVFLMRATRQLAISMSSRVAAGTPDAEIKALDAAAAAAAWASAGGDDCPGAGGRPRAAGKGTADVGSKGNVSGTGGGKTGDGDAGSNNPSTCSCDGTEPRPSPSPSPPRPPRPQPQPPLPSTISSLAATAAAAESEGWVSGLQPQRNTANGSSPLATSPCSAGSQRRAAAAAAAGSLPLYHPEALPLPARMGGPSRSSTSTGQRSVPPLSPPSTSSQPAAQGSQGSSRALGDIGEAVPAAVSFGEGDSEGSSPVRRALAPQTGVGGSGGEELFRTAPRSTSGGVDCRTGGGGGGRRGVGAAAGGGPITESLECAAGGEAVAAKAEAAEAVTAGSQEARSRRDGLVSFVFRGARAPAAAAEARLLPTSPYGAAEHVQEDFSDGAGGDDAAVAAAAADATRARASLRFGLGSTSERNGSCVESRRPGGTDDEGTRVGGPGMGSAAAAATTAAAVAPGPVAEAIEGETPSGGFSDRGQSMRLPSIAATSAGSGTATPPPPPKLPPLPQPMISIKDSHAAAAGAAAVGGIELESLGGAQPLYTAESRQVAGVVSEASGGSTGGSAVPSHRSVAREPSRLAGLRPSPIQTGPDGVYSALLGSITGARASSSIASTGPVGGGSGGGTAGSTDSSSGAASNDSPEPFSSVEQPRTARSILGTSAAVGLTHGSRRSRHVLGADADGWLAGGGGADGALGCASYSQLMPLSPMSARTEARLSATPSVPLIPSAADSPALSASGKRGGPWLADRLAALATLSAPTGAASLSVTATRTASVAATAAVAAAAPRRRDGDGAGEGVPAAAGAAPAATAAARGLSRLQPEALHVVNQYLRDYALGKKGAGWAARGGRTVASASAVLLVFAPLAPLAAAAAVAAALVIAAHSVVRFARGALMLARRCFRRGSGSGSAATTAGPSSFDRLASSLRLSLQLLLAIHIHVAGWLVGVPLALFAGALYGMGYVWGKDAVPLPWVWLACNAACLAGVLLLMTELLFRAPAWTRGVCKYPYAVALQVSSAAAAPPPPPQLTAAGPQYG